MIARENEISVFLQPHLPHGVIQRTHQSVRFRAHGHVNPADLPDGRIVKSKPPCLGHTLVLNGRMLSTLRVHRRDIDFVVGYLAEPVSIRTKGGVNETGGNGEKKRLVLAFFLLQEFNRPVNQIPIPFMKTYVVVVRDRETLGWILIKNRLPDSGRSKPGA